MTTLLETKTQEYADLPGVILGLDGWILKSVPKDFRGQFLAAYARALKIAFHPDREPNPVRKASMERYLQRVSEAVRYLSLGELEYELATDAAPTRRNPVVAMQREVTLRDDIIERKDQAEHELRRIAAEAEQSKQEAFAERSRFATHAKQMEARDEHLRAWLRGQAGSGVLAPIDVPVLTLSGGFMELSEIEGQVRDRQFIAKAAAEELTFRRRKTEQFMLLGTVAPFHLRAFACEEPGWLTDGILRHEAMGLVWSGGACVLAERENLHRSGVKLFVVASSAYDSLTRLTTDTESELRRMTLAMMAERERALNEKRKLKSRFDQKIYELKEKLKKGLAAHGKSARKLTSEVSS